MVLSRSFGERIVIACPDGATIFLEARPPVRSGKDRWAIGITAPNEYAIFREELGRDFKQKEARDART